MITSNAFFSFKCKTCFVLLSLYSFLFVSPLFAAEKEGSKVILVLDASGSMWQKIGEKTKIELARDAIEGIIKNWNPNSHLGLTVYGHREKGDCKDIESLIPVSQVNPESFMKTINAINPKGKTPLTEAVVQAAKELKYTEEKTTVILVSDGRETCAADPCAVGDELEKSGIDFTAHVIGFDVTDKAGVSQLQCLANNTGGLFLTAKNASELKSALAETARIVAEIPPQVMGTGKVWLDKKEFDVGEEIKVHFEASDNLHESAWIGIVPSEIEHGDEALNDRHDVDYQRLKGMTSGTLIFKTPGRIDKYDFRMHDTDHSGNEIASDSFSVRGVIAELKLDKRVFVTGQKIRVHFKTSASLVGSAWLGIIPSHIPHGSEETNDQHDLAYQYLEGKAEGSFTFVTPSKEGSYDFRIHDTNNNGREIGSITFKVLSARGQLTLNKREFSPGESIQVTFKVPEGLADNAWIGIIPSHVPHGSEAENDNNDLSYQHLNEKSTGLLTFTAPGEPGRYDFRAHDTDDNGSEIGFESFIVRP